MCDLPLIKIEEYETFSLDDFVKRLCEVERVRAGDLTLKSFNAAKDHPNGVYVFFRSVQGSEGNQVLYVGKVSSRTFLGRIPSHFEPRVENWMNHLSKKLSDGSSQESYESGVINALSTYIVLIGFPVTNSADESLSRKKKINALESILRGRLRPLLNGHQRDDVRGNTVAEILEESISLDHVSACTSCRCTEG